MSNRKRIDGWVFAVAAALLLLAAPGLAGVVFEIEVTDHDQSPPTKETTEAAVEGRNLRMTIAPSRPGQKSGRMIFRGDRGGKGEVMVVSDEQKSYYLVDEAAIEAMAVQIGAAMGAMQEALKQVPAEQRERLEEMMKDQPGMAGAMTGAEKKAVPELRKTGERATHAGYPCVKYVLEVDGRLVRELWVTDWSNVEGGDEARQAFAALGDFFRAMIDAMPAMPGGAGVFGELDSMVDSFDNGFPVVTRSFDESGELDDESVLRGSRRQAVDAAEFEPPVGYKRKTMF